MTIAYSKSLSHLCGDYTLTARQTDKAIRKMLQFDSQFQFKLQSFSFHIFSCVRRIVCVKRNLACKSSSEALTACFISFFSRLLLRMCCMIVFTEISFEQTHCWLVIVFVCLSVGLSLEQVLTQPNPDL